MRVDGGTQRRTLTQISHTTIYIPQYRDINKNILFFINLVKN